MKLALALALLSASASASSVIQTEMYPEGDTTCSKTPTVIARSIDTSNSCSRMSNVCFPMGNGPDSKVSSRSAKYRCLNGFSDAIQSSGSYVVQEVYETAQCSSNIQNYQAFMTDGCYSNGGSYFKAQCTVNGDTSIWSCEDNKCATCSPMLSGKDGECLLGLYKLKCVKSSASTDAKGTSAGSGVNGGGSGTSDASPSAYVMGLTFLLIAPTIIVALL